MRRRISFGSLVGGSVGNGLPAAGTWTAVGLPLAAEFCVCFRQPASATSAHRTATPNHLHIHRLFTSKHLHRVFPKSHPPRTRRSGRFSITHWAARVNDRCRRKPSPARHL